MEDDIGVDINIEEQEDTGLEIENDILRGPKGDKGDKGDTGNTGLTGNGISSVVLNNDYTLTINFTDGTSTTTTSIRGAQGEQGIQGIQGEQGAKGDKGDKGDTGDTGQAGYTPQKGIDYFTNTEVEEIKEEARAIQRSTVTTSTTISENTNYTIPLYYKVGSDVLDIYYMGEKLIKGTHYIEVGNTGSVSNTIQFYNWGQSVPIGRTIEFIVRGVYS